MTSNRDTITSPSNPLIKRLRTLERKKGRSDSGLFLAEGVRVITQGLKRGWRIDTLVVSNTVTNRPHIRELLNTVESTSARIVFVPERLLSKIARKENPQSVVAAFHQANTGLADLELPIEGIWLALYEVRDPGNLGTIIRTADCANVAGLILVENCCDLYSLEAVRASMGSIFDVSIANANFEDLASWAQSNEMGIVAASMNGKERHDAPIYSPRTLLLMGNEQAGLPKKVEQACQKLIRIPMRGGADSLNLAQATAVLTYEAWRQRDFS